MVLGELAGVDGNTCSGASSTSVSSTHTFCFGTTLLAEELQTEVTWTNKKIEREILLQIADPASEVKFPSHRKNNGSKSHDAVLCF